MKAAPIDQEATKKQKKQKDGQKKPKVAEVEKGVENMQV